MKLPASLTRRLDDSRNVRPSLTKPARPQKPTGRRGPARAALPGPSRNKATTPDAKARKQAKTAKVTTRNAVIAAVRVDVDRRDRYCRACKERHLPEWHMHELISRAKLRGKPPAEIFNLTNCLKLCPDCHKRAHHEMVKGQRFTVHGTDAQTPGGVRFAWDPAA